jgi:hypothetical protein
MEDFPMLFQNQPTTADLVWGASAIAPHLGRTVKGAFGALESGKVPGAQKIAGRWCLNLRVFLAAFEPSAIENSPRVAA